QHEGPPVSGVRDRCHVRAAALCDPDVGVGGEFYHPRSAPHAARLDPHTLVGVRRLVGARRDRDDVVPTLDQVPQALVRRQPRADRPRRARREDRDDPHDPDQLDASAVIFTARTNLRSDPSCAGDVAGTNFPSDPIVPASSTTFVPTHESTTSRSSTSFGSNTRTTRIANPPDDMVAPHGAPCGTTGARDDITNAVRWNA